ncbi:MAG: hypothetical protein Ct9H90mP23_1190 [Methanobacteriota archaeon]|nr:MAG: hypothetical protein Ct9H90mP23_1190 [Euryarchaeota archaeon]
MGGFTDLTLTMTRGQEENFSIIQSANAVNNGNDFTTQWDILVNDSLRNWAKDTQITIRVQYETPAESGPQCAVPAHFQYLGQIAQVVSGCTTPMKAEVQEMFMQSSQFMCP